MKMDINAKSLDNVLTFLADISSEVSIDFVCMEMSGEDDFCEEFCHGDNGPYKECWKHYLEGKWRRKDADDRSSEKH